MLHFLKQFRCWAFGHHWPEQDWSLPKINGPQKEPPRLDSVRCLRCNKSLTAHMEEIRNGN